MKKLLIVLLTLSLGVGAALSAPAESTANPTSGSTTLTAVIREVYTITIPNNTQIAFDNSATSIGEIGLATANLIPGNQVRFTANLTSAGAGTLKQSGNAATLPYTLKIGGTATNQASFTGVGTKPVTVEIAESAWDSAPAGSYSDTITFTVSCGASS